MLHKGKTFRSRSHSYAAIRSTQFGGREVCIVSTAACYRPATDGRGNLVSRRAPTSLATLRYKQGAPFDVK